MIESHQRSIQILEAMMVFQKRHETASKDAILYKKIGLSRIADKNEHYAKITKMAFDRLSVVYEKLISRKN